MQLFDNFERTSPGAFKYDQPSYDFLNHSSRQGAARARALCNAWFTYYPEAHQPNLGSRFVDDDNGKHRGAYFELLIHEILRRLNSQIEIEPMIEGQPGRPDFAVTLSSHKIQIEATSSVGLDFPADRDVNLRMIKDTINEYVPATPHFALSVAFSGQLTNTPSRNEICKPIRDFVKREGPTSDLAYSDPKPLFQYEINGLTVDVTLVPRKRHEHGKPLGRTISGSRSVSGLGSESIAEVVPKLRDQIKEKARRMNTDHSSLPLIVALSTAEGLFDMGSEVRRLLFGQSLDQAVGDNRVPTRGTQRREESVWFGKDGQPRRSKLAAVWVFFNAQPTFSRPAGDWNCLFLNPFHESDLPSELLRFTHARVIDDQMVTTVGQDLNEFLDIPHIPSSEPHKPSA